MINIKKDIAAITLARPHIYGSFPLPVVNKMLALDSPESQLLPRRGYLMTQGGIVLFNPGAIPSVTALANAARQTLRLAAYEYWVMADSRILEYGGLEDDPTQELEPGTAVCVDLIIAALLGRMFLEGGILVIGFDQGVLPDDDTLVEFIPYLPLAGLDMRLINDAHELSHELLLVTDTLPPRGYLLGNQGVPGLAFNPLAVNVIDLAHAARNVPLFNLALFARTPRFAILNGSRIVAQGKLGKRRSFLPVVNSHPPVSYLSRLYLWQIHQELQKELQNIVVLDGKIWKLPCIGFDDSRSLAYYPMLAN